jgi:hypothetical protein
MGRDVLQRIKSLKNEIMALNFNSKGYLHETIALTYEDFVQHFGTTQYRMEQIQNSIPYFQIFHSCGCEIVYVDGSFVSKKKKPEDIDICFDITGIKEEKILRDFPKFLDINERGRIRRELKCHIFTFTQEDTELFDILNTDRYHNPKGLVILDLKELKEIHAQK